MVELGLDFEALSNRPRRDSSFILLSEPVTVSIRGKEWNVMGWSPENNVLSIWDGGSVHTQVLMEVEE